MTEITEHALDIHHQPDKVRPMSTTTHKFHIYSADGEYLDIQNGSSHEDAFRKSAEEFGEHADQEYNRHLFPVVNYVVVRDGPAENGAAKILFYQKSGIVVKTPAL